MGIVVDRFSWDGGFILLMVASVLSIFFLALTWNVHNTSQNQTSANN